MLIKGLFNFDLSVGCKKSKFGIRLQMMRALLLHCDFPLFLLDLKKKKIISKKTLMDFCGSLKNIFLFAT